MALSPLEQAKKQIQPLSYDRVQDILRAHGSEIWLDDEPLVRQHLAQKIASGEIRVSSETLSAFAYSAPVSPGTLVKEEGIIEKSVPEVKTLASMTFQERVWQWLTTCLGEGDATSVEERVHRFLEECLELGQSLDCPREAAHKLVDYVYDGKKGQPHQEMGGVMLTIAGIACATGMDMTEAGETELERVWSNIPTIQAKHKSKPRNSPLPGSCGQLSRS